MKWIWAIFFGIFIFLSLTHYRKSRTSIKHFDLDGPVVAKISGIKTGVPEFIKGFKEYIDQYNADNRKANLMAAAGYLAAALTALVSFLSSQ